jgi:hypothetical protein
MNTNSVNVLNIDTPAPYTFIVEYDFSRLTDEQRKENAERQYNNLNYPPVGWGEKTVSVEERIGRWTRLPVHERLANKQPRITVKN